MNAVLRKYAFLQPHDKRETECHVSEIRDNDQDSHGWGVYLHLGQRTIDEDVPGFLVDHVAARCFRA